MLKYIVVFCREAKYIVPFCRQAKYILPFCREANYMYMLSFYREAKHFFREAEYIVNSSKQGTFFFQPKSTDIFHISR